MATATASGSGTSKGETIKNKKLLDRVSESLILKLITYPNRRESNM